MIQEIKRIYKFLKSNDGKLVRNRIVLVICIVGGLLIFNRFILIEYVTEGFKIGYNQSKLLFKNELSPYEIENQKYISRLAEEEGWDTKNNFENTGNPIFQYFFFFPFTVINNYQWAEAAFITLKQICIIFSTHLLLGLLKWNPKIWERIIIIFLTSSVFFVAENLLSANLSIFQITFLVGVLYFSEKNKNTISGILLGFFLIDPISVFYIMILFVIIIINKKKYAVLIWTFITIGLLSIFSFIYGGKWIFEWLRLLVLSPSRYPFISFIDSVKLKYGFHINQLFIGIPILLGLWLTFETLRTPKDTIENNIWLLSFGGILNHYMMVQSYSGSEIFFCFSLILVIGKWWEKINITLKLFLIIFLVIISYGILGWQYFGVKKIFLQPTETILFFLGIFLIINLYWIRPWVTNKYKVYREIN